MVVDGDKDGNEGSWVELGPGKQWVQIDLAKRANIYAVLIWHFHPRRAYIAMLWCRSPTIPRSSQA